MDWTQLITDLRSHGLTLQAIADQVGMTKGALHDLQSQRAKRVHYEAGAALVALHKEVTRPKRKGRAHA